MLESIEVVQDALVRTLWRDPERAVLGEVAAAPASLDDLASWLTHGPGDDRPYATTSPTRFAALGGSHAEACPWLLFVLSSGAGGYIAADDEHDARDRVSYIDGAGWLFWCEFGAIQRREHRQRRPVTVQLVSTLGQPEANAMADALDIAGRRHGTLYELRD